MKPAGLSEIKTELLRLNEKQRLDLCLRLAGYKKENKELLSYLLFMEQDKNQFIIDIKREIDILFDSISGTGYYLLHKQTRKALRFTSKWIRYTKDKEIEAELLLYYCKTLLTHYPRLRESAMMQKLLEGQIKKIQLAVGHLHEELQHDYTVDVERLLNN